MSHHRHAPHPALVAASAHDLPVRRRVWAPLKQAVRALAAIVVGAVLGFATITVYTEHWSWTSQVWRLDFATGEYGRAEGQDLRWRLEGDGWTHTGPHGLIGRDDIGTSPRVLVLGDSYVQAFQVDDSLKFTARLERAWNAAHPDRPITVLNRGASAQRIPDYIILEKSLDSLMLPQQVIIVADYRDFWDDTVRVSGQVGRRIDGERFSIDRFAPRREFYPDRQVQATRLAKWGLRSTLTSLGLAIRSHINPQPPTRPESDVPPDMAADVERCYARALEAQLYALQAVWGERLILAYHGVLPQVEADSVATGLPVGSAVRRREALLLGRAAALGIRVIDLRPATTQYVVESRQLPNVFPTTIAVDHMNAAGHAVVAEALQHALETDTLFVAAMSPRR